MAKTPKTQNSQISISKVKIGKWQKPQKRRIPKSQKSKVKIEK
jgi:hypothetical protein